MSFTQFNLKPFINDALTDLNFYEPSPIQATVIPVIQSGRDVIAQSQTGSGKTHAFLLPLLNKITAENHTQLVITAPSRELAEQLYQAGRQILSFSDEDLHIERAFGGTDTVKQANRLENAVPQVVVATPGRLLDLINNQLISVHQVTDFVVDEADMTLDLGFLNEVDQIAGRMPKSLNMYVFSATIPDKLKPFLSKYLSNPEWITIEARHKISDTIDNYLVPVKGRDRKALLFDTLTIGQPYLALIFANTKETVQELYKYLKSQGLNVGQIHGDLPARERRRVMKQVQNLDFQYVVATDLAARGIDIDGVSHVINYEVPNELEFFIHRVGRTGRQGKPGTAITFYIPDEFKDIEWLENKGIIFENKDIKDHQLIDGKDHDARAARQKAPEVDHTVAGMIERNKRRKVKPGYKKKLSRQISKHNKDNRMADQRKKRRDQRRKNKEDNQVDF
ncbi:DEAD/DEAH box helicase [Aerococcus urinaeequi]|uniref:DEAD/DEAH box helicase n=1 Tax=Aerococcus urinaeequi TaxID=51665 RepID=UPI0031819A0B